MNRILGLRVLILSIVLANVSFAQEMVQKNRTVIRDSFSPFMVQLSKSVGIHTATCDVHISVRG